MKSLDRFKVLTGVRLVAYKGIAGQITTGGYANGKKSRDTAC